MATTVLSEEEKQEENEGVTFSSETEDLMEWTSCRVSVRVLLLGLGGSPVDDGDGHNGQRDREDFGVKVLGEVVLLAHGAGGGRLDGSITC
eukprot:11351540-Ditylum_brightwellii.AAC.1